MPFAHLFMNRHKLFNTVLTSLNSIAKFFSRLYAELELAERQHKKFWGG